MLEYVIAGALLTLCVGADEFGHVRGVRLTAAASIRVPWFTLQIPSKAEMYPSPGPGQYAVQTSMELSASAPSFSFGSTR